VLVRSEGLGVASLRLFQSGDLSGDPYDPLRADALYGSTRHAAQGVPGRRRPIRWSACRAVP
jgi:hypothetical protein